MAGPAAGKVQVGRTSKFSVLDPKGSKVKHVAAVVAAAGGDEGAKKDGKRANDNKTRLTESTGKLIEEGRGKIGGDPLLLPNPSFLKERASKFDAIAAKQKERLAQKPKEEITILLPDGTEKKGISYETTPMDIAKSISKNLAKEVLVAEVRYSSRIEDDEQNVSSADGLEAEESDDEEEEGGASCGHDHGGEKEAEAEAPAELWDLLRPLIGNCELRLLKFEDKEAQAVFWHSSAHCLGLAMEKKYGCHLTHGPPVDNGFFYDCYMGNSAVGEKDLKDLDKEVSRCCKAKQTFDRLLLTKEEALDMFEYNAFKKEYIATRIPDGGCTTVYRNGDFVDLCRGPHVPYSTMIQAFNSTRTSSTNWLGKVTNDPLQRVYGVSFPTKDKMKKFQEFQEQAKKRDHRRVGIQQELFFFNNLSPGSAFFLPHGTRIYNRLLDFIRAEYWKRGYEEVTTPNMYNMDLWVQSGHAAHYKDAMFRFEVEGHEFAMKPMNCPGHCIMFSQGIKSWRELPLRYADFGVLHRNELSGALTGLTRVRRFCQDDAHVFCREDQIKQEVLGALQFMKHVYDIFGMSYKLELSTKPKKAMGDAALWVMAEDSLRETLDEFAGKGNWRVNAGDGAFYGPKIDIKVFDAMERVHQCATVQLDFQLPIRFNLKYSAGTEEHGDAKPEGDGGEAKPAGEKGGKAGDSVDMMKRPVMIHRAMLGSLERMIAVLTEHYGGKWPFWLSPRQALIVPVAQKYNDYAVNVKDRIHGAGFYVDVETSNKTLNKKVREGVTAKYNYILVVGEAEEAADEVNLRGDGQRKVSDLIQYFKELTEQHK
ncbi:unnamed protein product [Scytosiphon promiscuus]